MRDGFGFLTAEYLVPPQPLHHAGSGLRPRERRGRAAEKTVRAYVPGARPSRDVDGPVPPHRTARRRARDGFREMPLRCTTGRPLRCLPAPAEAEAHRSDAARTELGAVHRALCGTPRSPLPDSEDP